MHIVIVAAVGLVGLALLYFGAGLLGKTGPQGAYAFLWVWLVCSVGNGIFGVVRAGIPIINEIAAFIPIYGIPAAVAWYLAYRHGVGR